MSALTFIAAPAEVPPALSAAVFLAYVGFGAWGLARTFVPPNPTEARLARTHRVAAAVTLGAALAYLVWDVRLQGDLRWDPMEQRLALGFVGAAVMHGVCRAFAGKPWIDWANPRSGYRLVAEVLAWCATGIALFAAAWELR